MCTGREPGPGRPPGRLRAARTTAYAAALVTALLAPLLLWWGSPTYAVAAPAAPPVAASDDTAETSGEEPTGDPLDVTIDDLSAAAIPDEGPLVVSGTVRNDSTEEWRAVQVYGLFSSAPMTTAAELEEAAETPASTVIGQRITDDGLFAEVGDLAPGATRSFTVRLPADRLPSSGAGVYWFGLQALGENDEGRDAVADGRTRTFVPLVPPGATRNTDGAVETSLVVPVRHVTRRDDDGRVSNLRAWADDLAPDGRLDRLLRFGAEAAEADGQVTWLLDPSVPATVAEIVAGNSGLSIDPTVEPGPDPDTPDVDPSPSVSGSVGSASPSASPSSPDGAGDAGSGGAPSAAQRRAAGAGSDWLERMREVLPAGAVWALPYGDLDVDAVGRTEPRLLARARLRSAQITSAQGLEDTRPAVAPPSGYLDPATLDLLPGADAVLLADRAVGASAEASTGEPEPQAGLVRTQGRTVALSSTAAGRGGPGPDDPHSAVSIRQRLASEAAVRLLGAGAGEEPAPLVVVAPDTWAPESGTGFFSALADLDWLELTPPDDSDGGAAPAELDYPAEERAREVPREAVEAAVTAVRSAGVLEDVLPLNDGVADQATDETLNALTYLNRGQGFRARSSVARTERQVDRLLGEISVVAPTRLTPASDDGRFSVEVVNGLAQPVVVRLSAITDGTLEVSAPDEVEVPADTGTTVRMNASSIQPGLSTIELQVTDSRGNPVGASDRVPVRALPVSDVIWWILGLGSALLFAAIVVRLVRRFAAARRAAAAR